MYGTVIEFNTLSYPYRSGAEYKYLFLRICLKCFGLRTIYRIIIRCSRFKFGSAGIDHLICRYNAVRDTHIMYLFFCLTRKPADDIVRELYPLGFLQKFRRKFLGLKPVFHFGKQLQLIYEPRIIHRYLMYLFFTETAAQCFSYHIYPLVIDHCQTAAKFIIGKACEIIASETVHMLFH